MIVRRGLLSRVLAPALLALTVALGGCATQTQSLMQASPAALPDLPRRHELPATPFFAQERYQCGPAALAMALQAAGVKVSPDALVSQVYVPERQGSLQPEMLAAARRNGAPAMTIAPRLDALLREVAAGHPVIVLQNLSLAAFPLWHYAVVIGYDLERGEAILHSGTTERLVMPLATFERTWQRGGNWGMTALAPGRLPVSVSEPDAVAALVAFEKSAEPARALQAYRAGLARWPENLVLQLGLANAAYAGGDLATAAAVLQHATRSHPDSGAAFNNLATVLAELGDEAGARTAAQRAVEIGGPWAANARATLAAIGK